jgi:hypothetical protein
LKRLKLRGRLKPEVRELLGDDFVLDVGRSIVPICRDVRGSPKVIGTGFLITDSGMNFLVSAAHVLDEMFVDEHYFPISPKVRCRIAGHCLYSGIPDSATRDDDRLDVGIVILEIELGTLGPGFGILGMPLSRLAPFNPTREEKWFAFYGFPASTADVNPVSKRFLPLAATYCGQSVPAARYAQFGVKTQTHVVLPFERKNVFGNDGLRRHFPKPAGMSGSPLWELRPLANGGRRIVGVMTRHKERHRVVVATDVGFVVDFLSHYIQKSSTRGKRK